MSWFESGEDHSFLDYDDPRDKQIKALKGAISETLVILRSGAAEYDKAFEVIDENQGDDEWFIQHADRVMAPHTAADFAVARLERALEGES